MVGLNASKGKYTAQSTPDAIIIWLLVSSEMWATLSFGRTAPIVMQELLLTLKDKLGVWR